MDSVGRSQGVAARGLCGALCDPLAELDDLHLGPESLEPGLRSREPRARQPLSSSSARNEGMGLDVRQTSGRDMVGRIEN